MQKINNILVGIALSPYSQEIFNYACDLCLSLNANLISANIINERDVSAVAQVESFGYDVDGDHFVQSLRQEREAQLERIIKISYFPKERVTSVIRVGNPIDEILRMSIEYKVDMIVQGVKGRTNLEHVFVGSVAEKLFRRSPVTLVSYRPKDHAERIKKRIKV